MGYYNSLLLHIDKEIIACVDPLEDSLAVINIIIPLTIIAIKDADRVNLLHLIILIPDIDMFRYRLAGAKEYTFKIV